MLSWWITFRTASGSLSERRAQRVIQLGIKYGF
jgi:hypothetical protein